MRKARILKSKVGGTRKIRAVFIGFGVKKMLHMGSMRYANMHIRVRALQFFLSCALFIL
jgi:hypothetical protein